MSVHLQGITWEHERGHGSVVAASRAYREQQPDVEITWTARSLQAFADQPLEALVERYDLLVVDHPHIPSAAEEGLLAPLDEHLPAELDDAAFVGPSHATYRHGGAQYGLATDAAAQVAAYRPDLLPEPPRTWPEVLELARAGRVLWPAKPIDAFSSLVTLCAGTGAAVMTADGFVDRDVFEESFQVLGELARLVPQECLSANPIEVAERLTGSDRWAYAPLLFGYTNYSREGYRATRLAYTDIPLRDGEPRGSLLGGAGIAVSARSRHVPEAARFAAWLASGPVQRGAYFDGGGQPGHLAAWEDETLDAATLGFFSGTRRTLEQAYVRPRHPRFLALQDTASPWVTEALAGRTTPAELFERLDQASRDHLREDDRARR
ncbi:extracellular solute-binding protein [Auraticoccus sp. F435]|uniref:Extracellular solute-binding protein n=1 Tax=Auraticoccus cholistanensis TaxID=2656650 RepID=A0A6A9UT01_9ACTN|nr:extracellular solute-binding protein [Auraticoccus cholistanensis]MVA74704.1 extracellular solute-binding protein [Auraticoccus cholistanensis]